MRLVGIDCATDASKVGVAYGHVADGALTVETVRACSKNRSVASDIAEWIRSDVGSVIIAIDAPLGWPGALGPTLSAHVAGEVIAVPSNDLFRRETDRFIQRTLGKTPLDVGADRIARTAHAALRLLGEMGDILGFVIPLAWSSSGPAVVSAIEVYPAASLLAHGMRSTGYKKPEQIEERREILTRLHASAEIRHGLPEMEANADVLDAAICLLAAADFVSGTAMAPQDLALAIREGWIWTRPLPSAAHS